jgi:hypothetical protein
VLRASVGHEGWPTRFIWEVGSGGAADRMVTARP